MDPGDAALSAGAGARNTRLRGRDVTQSAGPHCPHHCGWGAGSVRGLDIIGARTAHIRPAPLGSRLSGLVGNSAAQSVSRAANAGPVWTAFNFGSGAESG